jgi:peptidoglycan-associated lipoprotein
MKRFTLFTVLTLGLLLTLGTTGCKKSGVGITKIPGRSDNMSGRNGKAGDIENANRIPDDGTIGTATNPLELSGTRDITGRTQTRGTLQSETIYFDLDSATIKSDEKAKLDKVAEFFKKPENDERDLLVEGHCDERGTEGYNISLGEKRALAAREYLIGQGVKSDHVHTLSQGEMKPAVPGHDESAWSKNRRAEFIVVEPAGK